MKRMLHTLVALGAIVLSTHAYTATVSLKDDGGGTRAASPQADNAQTYQSCSQVNAPLFSDYPPKTNYDLNSYMHYTVYQSGNLKNLIMWGAIDECDEARLREVLEKVRPIGTVSLWSGGGSVDEAMAMGRTMRAYGVTTLVQDGNECVSACNFLFMAGVIRMIEPRGSFKVHMFDNNAADSLRSESAYPPTDLASFLRRFPFRSDESMDDVDAEVKAVNDSNRQALAALRPIDQSDEALLNSKSSSGSTPVDQSSKDIDTANSYCSSALNFDLESNDSLADQESYISSCIKNLSKPYTNEDWFADQARTEDVKAIQQNAAQTAAKIARYLSEMSISLKFLTDFADIPNASPKELSVDELRDLYIVNSD
jgi:hypothetical protein